MRRHRMLLAGLVLLSGILTLLAVPMIGRGGAVSSPNQIRAIRYLLGLYLPLFVLIGSFHFGSRETTRSQKRGADDGRFGIALTFVSFWCFAPAILFAITRTIEGTLELLTEFKAFGDTLVLAALGYYFGRHDQGGG